MKLMKMGNWFFRSMAGCAIVLALLTPGVTSCKREEKKKLKENHEKEKEEEKTAALDRRFLQPGETVTVEFIADGLWHPAPYSARNGDKLSLVPHPDSESLGPNVIEFRIGENRQVISGQSMFAVTRPGAFGFRLNPAKAGTYMGKCKVNITRLK